MFRYYVRPIGTKKDDSFYVPNNILFQAWRKVSRDLSGGLYDEDNLPEMLDRTVRGCARKVDCDIAEEFGGKKFSKRKLLKIVTRIYQKRVLWEIESACYKYRCE